MGVRIRELRCDTAFGIQSRIISQLCYKAQKLFNFGFHRTFPGIGCSRGCLLAETLLDRFLCREPLPMHRSPTMSLFTASRCSLVCTIIGVSLKFDPVAESSGEATSFSRGALTLTAGRRTVPSNVEAAPRRDTVPSNVEAAPRRAVPTNVVAAPPTPRNRCPLRATHRSERKGGGTRSG